jgi:UDP-3-O-[3-hydroxymyristoyl] N-acetylglucosamine deacetylase
MSHDRSHRTISSSVCVEGVGLHTGAHVRLTLLPAAPGTGIVFRREDLGVDIPARLENVSRTAYSTTLAANGADVTTVEHLLAACAGAGITNLRISVDGPEVPILDGSAAPLLALVQSARVVQQAGTVAELAVREVVRVGDDERWLELRPAARFAVDYRVSFTDPAVGRQRFIVDDVDHCFESSIAPARTFGFLREVAELRRRGLGRGGSLENCIIVDGGRVLSGALRFRDEFVRHKVLDLLGDLALLEHPLRAAVVAHRAGDTLHVAAMRALLARPQAWELIVPAGRLSRTVTPYRSEADAVLAQVS